MKRPLLVMLMVCAGCSYAKEVTAPVVIEKPDPVPVVDPNSFEAQAAEVEAMVVEITEKEKILKEKIYTGTIDQVYTERIADVNDITGYAKTLQAKAEDVCKSNDIEVHKKDFIKAVMDKVIEKKQQQKRNNEVIAAVSGAIADPNFLPDVSDPNYVERAEAMNELLAFCIEVLSPK